MDGLRPPTFAISLWTLVWVAGCAGGPAPQPATKKAAEPQATEEPRSAATDAAPPSSDPGKAPASRGEEIPPATRAGTGSTVVVDPGGESAPPSLAEVARAERERRAHAGPPVAVITDKTLPKYAKGSLTVAEPKQKPAAPGAAEQAEAERSERYWRDRGLEIRQRWRSANDEVKDLEKRAAGWRRRFYAENDSHIRDAQVKPEWDRVLDRLHEARTDADAAQKELAAYLEEGRRAGALPGWLREGLELEPEPEKRKSNAPVDHQSIEPPVYEEPAPPPA